jgi:hypothetical protein
MRIIYKKMSSEIMVDGALVQVNEMIDDSSMNATAADGSGRIFTKVGDVWTPVGDASSMGGKRRKTKRKGGSKKKRRGGSKKRKSGKKRR